MVHGVCPPALHPSRVWRGFYGNACKLRRSASFLTIGIIVRSCGSLFSHLWWWHLINNFFLHHYCPKGSSSSSVSICLPTLYEPRTCRRHLNTKINEFYSRICMTAALDLYLGHYSDVIMRMMAYQITNVSIVYLTVCPGVDQIKHRSSASLAIWLRHDAFPLL